MVSPLATSMELPKCTTSPAARAGTLASIASNTIPKNSQVFFRRTMFSSQQSTEAVPIPFRKKSKGNPGAADKLLVVAATALEVSNRRK
jgi:hypothetical protein